MIDERWRQGRERFAYDNKANRLANTDDIGSRNETFVPLSKRDPASIVGEVSFTIRAKTPTICFAPASINAACRCVHAMSLVSRCSILRSSKGGDTDHLCKSRGLTFRIRLSESLRCSDESINCGNVWLQVSLFRTNCELRKDLVSSRAALVSSYERETTYPDLISPSSLSTRSW